MRQLLVKACRQLSDLKQEEIADNKPNPELYKRTAAAAHGKVDAFVSHRNTSARAPLARVVMGRVPDASSSPSLPHTGAAGMTTLTPSGGRCRRGARGVKQRQERRLSCGLTSAALTRLTSPRRCGVCPCTFPAVGTW